jgi:hypothetical protein
MLGSDLHGSWEVSTVPGAAGPGVGGEGQVPQSRR